MNFDMVILFTILIIAFCKMADIRPECVLQPFYQLIAAIVRALLAVAIAMVKVLTQVLLIAYYENKRLGAEQHKGHKPHYRVVVPEDSP